MNYLNCLSAFIVSFFFIAVESNAKLIEEEQEGVKFYLRLPPKEIKTTGVVVYLPTFGDNHTAEMAYGSGVDKIMQFKEKDRQDYLNKGYAILGWITPAQPKAGDFCLSYGVNSDDLSDKMKTARSKRWDTWLPKIDNGINMLTEKYDLPTNGFLAVTFCISCDRLSRYIDYKPERFSAHFSNLPIGLHSVNDNTKHIYTFLYDRKGPKNSYDYYSGLKRFGYKCDQIGAPYTIMRPSKGSPPHKQFVEYLIVARSIMKLKHTLSEAEVQKFGQAIHKDLQRSPFSYDHLAKDFSIDGEKPYYHELFTCSYPQRFIGSLMKKRKIKNSQRLVEYMQ